MGGSKHGYEGILFDCHIHIDPLVVNAPLAAVLRGKPVGVPIYQTTSLEKIADHVKKEGIISFNALYENQGSLSTIRSLLPDVEVNGYYFMRDPKSIDEASISRLHEGGLLQGIKIHPILDNFVLAEENIGGALSVARTYGIPILYHSDDRTGSMHLTSPSLQKDLIESNPDVIFIIGHGGAYATPRMVGSHKNVSLYWEGSEAPFSRYDLIGFALKLASEHDNAFYDLTVCTNKIKARLITDFTEGNPSIIEKILVGSDYPIKGSKASSQLIALEYAGMKKKNLDQIASNRI